jgi:N-formylglutamate deformylase
VLLHVPHAGTEIPAWTRPQLLLDDAALASELAALTDHHTDRIAGAAAEQATVRPWMLLNRASRFVVDVERFPDGREELAAVGMAAVYTRGTRGQRLRADDPEHREALLAAYYHPWAQAVQDAVLDRLTATGRAVLIDLHSYPSGRLPYERHAAGPRPMVCLGTDPAHTPGWLVDAARTAFAELGPIALNTPFSGTYVPLVHLGRDRRVASIMIEIRRDGYLIEPAGPPTAGTARTTRALAALISAVDPHNVIRRGQTGAPSA